MPEREDLEAALLPVIEALETLHVDYFIGGSVASSLHGVLRSTNDVDIVAALRREHAEPLAAALDATHACDAGWIADAIARHGSFNALHVATAYKVDVFVPGDDAFARQEMERRVAIPFPGLGRPVFVASAEDIVLQKLRWFRQGGEVSERQWNDVLGVLKLQADAVDRAYLRQWAGALGVNDLLERALGEAR